MDAWLAAHPTDAVTVAAVKAHAEQAEHRASVTVDVEAALRSVQSRLSGVDAVAPSLTVLRGGASRSASASGNRAAVAGPRWTRFGLAAAAAVVAMLGLRQWRSGAADATSAPRIVATKVGVRDSLTLADGSQVVLAPGSRLTVPAAFADGDRTVVLEGAAYFDVKHDEAHPFTVRTADAEIRDIGTSFSVKTDAIGGVSVAVTQGIVALRKASSQMPTTVELRAGDRGVIKAGAVAVSRGIVTADDMAWTRGQLVYRDAALSEVQADLKRWYGITLQVADSSLTRLTVTMGAQPDSARVISSIALILGAEAEQHGDTVILHSAGRGTTP
jgi:transmembrane sensor